uniref:TFIIS N-terminal domain-containing protein n=1 Tax=Pinguiococcus pyrenoidosus TaxID=172671 RepID=A0A7R9YA66_9STRA|mmetsp:Transcript_1313/g.5620  ORF Transcript_1313/g.5620 Transcript_1313/m.5620 type:complete len:474 (+) Transcript_1313:79-1500(+)
MSAEEEPPQTADTTEEEQDRAPEPDEDDDDLFNEDDDEAEDKAQEAGASESKGDDDDDDDEDDLFADDDAAGDAGGEGLNSEDSDDDLFKDSDDEEGEQPSTGNRRRLTKGANKKRVTKGLERFDQRRAPKARPGHASEAKESYLEDEEAYASEEDVQATAEDHRFIADDDDHADIMGEYARDRQSWDDREFRVAGAKRGPNRGGAAAGVTESAYQKLEDGPVKEVFAKKSRKKKMSGEEKEQLVQNFLRQMSEAHAEDEAIRSDPTIKRPALHKLQMLPKVVNTLQKKDLHNLLLDYDLLREMAKWIQPLDGTKRQLPNETVRTTLIQRLHDLPIEIDHLKRSGMGKVVMGLYKHPLENRNNKRSLKALIEKWAPRVYQTGGGRLAQRADVDTSTVRRTQVADAGGRMNLNRSLGKKRKRNAVEDGDRPRLEWHLGYDYQKMPAPRMDRVQQAAAQPRFQMRKKLDSKGKRR